jgi:dynein assembly factor 5, axonemal
VTDYFVSFISLISFFNVNDMLAANFKLLYPELLKRLDDASDDIRIQACSTISAFANSLLSWNKQWESHYTSSSQENNGGFVGPYGTFIETRLDDVHWNEMIKGVLIHVDDSSVVIQVLFSFVMLP